MEAAKKKSERIIVGDDYNYWSDGTELGDCEQCSDDIAYHFDENGAALCDDCLIMNHLDGKYDD